MTKTIKTLSIVLAVMLTASLAFSQTATTSTTLSSAITTTSQQQIVVASATNILAPTSSHSGSQLYIDRELMDVSAVNGTTITVVRGTGGTRAIPHSSGATVYVGYSTVQGNPNAFNSYPPKLGACTATNEVYLPQLSIDYSYNGSGYIEDCFGSQWQVNLNLPLYTLTVAPNAQRSASSPSAGNVISLTAQAGGAQSATTGSGGAGGASSLVAGAGGLGGSSSGTAGAGGAVSVTGGAGGAGPVTGGAGGSVTVKAGAGGNGSSAGGSGGNTILVAGAAGTGGTGVAGKIQFKDAADNTKIAAFDLSGLSTATTRTITIPDASITLGSTVMYACGTTSTCAATVTNNMKIASGNVALSSGTPSTVTITALPFTATSSYNCTASPEGNTAAIAAGGAAITKVSASSITITGPNTVTTVIDYVCVGT